MVDNRGGARGDRPAGLILAIEDSKRILLEVVLMLVTEFVAVRAQVVEERRPIPGTARLVAERVELDVVARHAEGPQESIANRHDLDVRTRRVGPE